MTNSLVLEEADFFLKHFLNPVLGHEDVSHGYLELGGCCRARKSLDGGQVEGGFQVRPAGPGS